MLPVILLIASCLHVCISSDVHYYAPQYPFQDPTLSLDVRTDDLINRLTLDEIVPQTIAVYGGSTPAIPRLGILPYVWISECLHGQVDTNTTSFPQSIGLAAAFSLELIHNISEAISYEARAHWNGARKAGIFKSSIGLSCFSPVINIMRHPLWGRNQESYGEDPFLSGTLVQGYVRGLQGDHPKYVRANAGCKHFDVHGGPENIPVERYGFDAKVSMRDWRMTFLPAFKMCVEAGSLSLMCSYNSVNGIPTCANELLLTNITRNEWGFKGYIVSDAGAISNIISYHHYEKTNDATVAACIKAGCNLELGSNVYSSQQDALKTGLLTEAQIRANLRPLIQTRIRLGEFDPEEMNPYNLINMSVVQSAEHRKLAVDAALKTFVLMKNNGVLPLTQKYNKLAIVGPFATDKSEIFGNYASNMVAQYTESLADGLVGLSSNPLAIGQGCTDTHCNTYNNADVMKAVTGADLVIVSVGTGPSLESEANDRRDIDLPGQQLQMLQDAVSYATTGVPVVLLLFNAGPLDITWAKLDPRVSAIVEVFYPGQSTGEAVFTMLTASGGPNSVPAGRLPATWPSFLGQVPPITDYNMVGHTYRYYIGDPLYPFGYGLSYSTFSYTTFTLSSTSIQAGQPITATVGVVNTGKFDADEVVQVYLEWTNATIPVPKIQLASFRRVLIKAGEHRVVDLVINPERMAVWEDNVGWTYIKGVSTLYGGGQQPGQRTDVGSNVLKASFSIS